MKRMQADRLGQRLKEDARRENAGFSPALHERIMGALRAEGLAAEQEKKGNGRGWVWRIAAPVGVAAGLAAGVWLFMHSSRKGGGGPGLQVVEQLPSVPTDLAGPVKREVTGPTAEAMEQGKYGYLDRDAERLMVFVADQLPQFPTGRRK